MSNGSWERHNVADIVHAGEEQHEPLKAHPKAAVRNSPVAAQVQVPLELGMAMADDEESV